MESTMDFVLIPEAWMGAWVWEVVTDGLRALGHRAHPVTLSGLTGDADVSDVELETHVSGVLSVLEEGDMREALVVGHSYSGIVAGQVADREPVRVGTVFVDAFLPHEGKSMLDAFSESQREHKLRQIAENGGCWPPPDVAGAADGHGLSAEQARWLVERLVDHPGRTVSEPLVLNRPWRSSEQPTSRARSGSRMTSRRCARSRLGPSVS
jgi:pimeloyl-ACP methyl ester carboxylesterase